MQPYQEEYIRNCQSIRDMTASYSIEPGEFDRSFEKAIQELHRARKLAQRNTELIQEQLLPLLDDVYRQEEESLRELEEFADVLTKGPKSPDVALGCQIHEALLSRARRSGKREDVIRELYKLGMARYGLWYMLTGLNIPEVSRYSNRMRYCFVEASSFLKYFEEFEDDETKGFILRSLANIYLGDYKDWRDKLSCVRHTMQVFQDKRYQENAPSLPWNAYFQSIHRQMSGLIPYNSTGGDLSADEVADVMESVHLVYERRFADIRHNGDNVDAHNLLPYYAIEFSCGLITKEELVTRLETLLDDVDPTLYDSSNLYQIISLPAYYVQYLKVMPELIPPRRQYIIQLYDRMMKYVRSMPGEAINDIVQLYVRQVLSVFVEVEGGITYRDLVLSLMARFSPDLYAHGYATAQMTMTLCETIWEGDPDYFSDIPEIAALSDPAEKKKALLDLALYSSLLHDVGKINFTSVYDHQSRQMLRSEAEILQFHTHAGWLYLKEYDSTRMYADAAFGHHRWYDGGDGYPAQFQRIESPYRALIDVLHFADYMDQEDEDSVALTDRVVPFEEKISQALRLAGRRFSPLVMGWLRDQKLLEKLRGLYGHGRREGLYHCYLKVMEDAGK